jgi:hypothetical protein
MRQLQHQVAEGARELIAKTMGSTRPRRRRAGAQIRRDRVTLLEWLLSHVPGSPNVMPAPG